MEYPLQYFREYIDKYKRNSCIDYMEPNEDIYDMLDFDILNSESCAIIKHLRTVYYGRTDFKENLTYLTRFAFLLINVKKEIEKIAGRIEKNLVLTSYPPRDYVVLDNFKKIYNELASIMLEMMSLDRTIFEGFKMEEMLHLVRQTTSEDIYLSHVRFRKHVISRFTKYEDVVQEYDISVNEIEYEQYKKRFDIVDEYIECVVKQYVYMPVNRYSEKNIFYYYKKYKLIYMNNLNLSDDERADYIRVHDFLEKTVNPIISRQILIDHIINTLVYNNICHDIVLEYFEDQFIGLLENSDDRAICEYFKRLKRRFDIVLNHKCSKYNVDLENIDNNEELLINKLYQMFSELNEEYERPCNVSNEKDYDRFENDRLIFNGTAECMGLLFELFFQVNFFQSNRKKSAVGRILSKTVFFNNKKNQDSYDVHPLAFSTIYDAFMKGGRDYDEVNHKIVKDKLEEMLKILNSEIIYSPKKKS